MRNVADIFLIYSSILFFVLALFGKVIATPQNVNITRFDFNYNIKVINSEPEYRPKQVFSNQKFTYLKYPNIQNAKNVPKIFLSQKQGNSKQWYWDPPFVVIKAKVNQIRIAAPGTMRPLYDITHVSDQKINTKVIPAPHIKASRLQGFFIEANAGTGMLDSNGITFSGGGMLGYDYALNDFWLIGIAFAYQYNGQTEITKNGTEQDVQSMDFDILPKLTILFANGLKLYGQAGLAYISEQSDSDNNNKIAAKFGGGIGYQWNNDFGTTFKFYHVFGKDNIASASAINIGLSYHF
jgi:hypothetical protein